MVFATDNPAGERIMEHIYARAAETQPYMQREAAAMAQAIKEEESGEAGLFPPPPRSVDLVTPYEHRPPWPPPTLSADGRLRET